MFDNSIVLNNGVKIPQLGLGTWFIDDDKVADAVKAAVEIGYRHIDTAQAYGNERGVGEGVRTCGIPREELFVVSKVAAEHKTYEEAMAGINETIWSAAAKNIGPQISKTLMECGMSRSFSASPGVMSGESVYFHALISAVSAIRFIKSRAANTTPISMATTRSKNTVKKKVATRTMMSLLGAILQRRKKEDQSARYRYNIKGCKEH